MSDKMTVVCEGIPFDVTFYATPLIPASTLGHPDDRMPEEGGDFELQSVEVGGYDLTPFLDDSMIATIENAVKEKLK